MLKRETSHETLKRKLDWLVINRNLMVKVNTMKKMH